MWHGNGLWKQDQKSSFSVVPCICLIHSCFKADTFAFPPSWNSLPSGIHITSSITSIKPLFNCHLEILPYYSIKNSLISPKLFHQALVFFITTYHHVILLKVAYVLIYLQSYSLIIKMQVLGG